MKTPVLLSLFYYIGFFAGSRHSCCHVFPSPAKQQQERSSSLEIEGSHHDASTFTRKEATLRRLSALSDAAAAGSSTELSHVATEQQR
jgi:Tfp pilus assembly protein PilO